jgi:hypothetical protein
MQAEKNNDLHIVCAMVLSLPKKQTWFVIKIQLFDIEATKLTSKLVSIKFQAESNCPFMIKQAETLHS